MVEIATIGKNVPAMGVEVATRSLGEDMFAMREVVPRSVGEYLAGH